jgi:GTPase SAR1 family protein
VDDITQKGEESAEIILIGNKTDLKEQRKVEMEEAEQFAKLCNAQYLETSTLTQENIKEAFESILLKIVGNLKSCESKSMSSISRKNSYTYTYNDFRLQKPSISLRHPPEEAKEFQILNNKKK